LNNLLPAKLLAKLPAWQRRLPGASLFALGLLGPAIQAAAESPRIAPLGIRNAASFGFAESGGGIAPGSIFGVFGTDLGPETPLQGTIPYPDSLPNDATGTRVEVRSLESGATVAAYLLYTSASQVMGILLSTTPLGRAQLTVIHGGEASEPQEVDVLSRAVGIFTQSMDGRGPGVVQNVVSNADQPLNQLTRPALPGQNIVLWATGLGAIDGADNVAPPVGNVGDDVEVEIAGIKQKASYAGRAPGFPGVDQINVRLPEGEPLDDCYIALAVWAGGRPSQQVVFSAASAPGPCKHPFGLPAATLANLDAGGRVALGQFRVSRYLQQLAPQPWFDAAAASFGGASGGFFSVDAGDLAVFSPSLRLDPPPEEPGCHVTNASDVVVARIGWFNSDAFALVPESRIRQLDAGTALQLLGPGGKQQELQRLPPVGDSALVFDYSTQHLDPDGTCCTDALPGEYFDSGEWTIEGTGGADVGAFQATLQLPPFPGLNLPETVNRDQDAELSWSPAGFSETEQIRIAIGGPSEIEAGGQTQVTVTAQINCVALASSGRVTVPASLMREVLTPSGEYAGQWFVSLIRPDSEAAVFSAPGIDYGALLLSFGQFRAVGIE
jgi:uncharacterized protein (TIGR03437 family)